MTAVQLVALLVRLFALWLAIRTVLEVPAIYNFLSDEKDATYRVVSLVAAFASLAFCVLLWKFPLWISKRIVPGDKEAGISISQNEFLSIGITLIGIWTVIDALPPLVRQFLFINADENAGVVLGDDFYAYVYALVFKVIIGIWLFVGAPGIRKMLNWFRIAGVRY